MVATVLINGHLIDPANRRNGKADLMIEKGVITAIGKPGTLAIDNCKVIDAEGLKIMPGIVDCCARLREPGDEHVATIKSEVLAAASGGITTLCYPPDTDPVIDDPAVVELIHQKAVAAGKSSVVVLGALTHRLRGEHLSEMYALKKAGCVGVSNARQPVENTLVLKQALSYAATFDIPVFIEPADYSLSKGGCAHRGKISARLGLKGIPVSAETIAISTVLDLAVETGVRLHIGRLSSAKSVELIARAKDEGLPVTADVSAHQLFLTEHDISNFNSACHVIPPLRTQRDMEALRRGVVDGTIDIICSDHQPHDTDAKQAPFASTQPGMSTLETFLPLCLRLQEAEDIKLTELLSRITSAPASILGIEAGSLEVGARADICMFDDTEDWQLSPDSMHSHGKNSPFFGWNLQGRVKYTFVNGKVAYKNKD
jgi:dihydroorotase